MRFADCHPSRKHHAKGLCKLCYAKSLPKKPKSKTPEARIKEQARSRKGYEKTKLDVRNKLRQKNLRYIRNYGITLEQVEAMKVLQNNRCAICAAKTTSFHVDHHHETNTVRGLLCGSCNRGIGMLQECTTIMLGAIKYLLYWSTRYEEKSNV